VTGHGITSPISYPQYVVIEDYTKAQSGELSVAAGTVLYIVEKKHTGEYNRMGCIIDIIVV